MIEFLKLIDIIRHLSPVLHDDALLLQEYQVDLLRRPRADHPGQDQYQKGGPSVPFIRQVVQNLQSRWQFGGDRFSQNFNRNFFAEDISVECQ